MHVKQIARVNFTNIEKLRMKKMATKFPQKHHTYLILDLVATNMEEFLCRRNVIISDPIMTKGNCAKINVCHM